MSTKEIQAWVQVLGALVISGLVALQVNAAGFAPTISAAAWQMLWAILYSIGLSIVAVIVGVILVSIAQREEVKDERADERDRMINRQSMANAYFTLSIGVLGVLFWQAFGLEGEKVPYALFGISMLAGLVSGATQIVLYRRS